MNTKHTPQIVDFNDSKKAIRALKGSVDDAFLLLNRLESNIGKVKSGVSSIQISASVSAIKGSQQNQGGQTPFVGGIPILTSAPDPAVGMAVPWILLGDYDTIQLVYPDGQNHNKQIVLSDIIFTP